MWNDRNGPLQQYLGSPGVVYTIAAIGKLKNLRLMPIVDSIHCDHYCKACVRFVHLSPNAPAVDITLPDGTILFGNVSFTEVTDSIPVKPDVYNLQVRLACTETVALDVPHIKLESGKYYTIYAVGLVGMEPPLQALLVEDLKMY